ncbi:hypothetical protein ABEB36_008309 [Hypothenemus hampei]|uniref:Uncharacterized protein n=1 Tax=Hypothenemus hampei TaxID=57062 RepID=A0ABD1ELG5_HYPHA
MNFVLVIAYFLSNKDDNRFWKLDLTLKNCGVPRKATFKTLRCHMQLPKATKALLVDDCSNAMCRPTTFFSSSLSPPTKQLHIYLHYHESLTNHLATRAIISKNVRVSYKDFLKSMSFIMPQIKIQGSRSMRRLTSNYIASGYHPEDCYRILQEEGKGIKSNEFKFMEFKMEKIDLLRKIKLKVICDRSTK